MDVGFKFITAVLFCISLQMVYADVIINYYRFIATQKLHYAQ